MDYSQSNQIISFMILGCILILLMIIFSKPIKFAAKFLLRAIISCCSIFVLNFMLAGFNLDIGINFFNAAVGGIFGSIGVAALYIIKFIIR